MAEIPNQNFENNSASNTERSDRTALRQVYAEIGESMFSAGQSSNARELATQNEVLQGVLPPLELVTVSDEIESTQLPDGMQGTLVFEDNFQNGDKWFFGIQNTSGRGPGPDHVWHGDQGFTPSDAAVTFGPDGLSITSDASQGTFGEISSRNPIGGDGQPYYIEFTMMGGENWPAVWLLPVDGEHGAKEIDLQEGNMPGHNTVPAERSLNAAYHWNFRDISEQELLVHDTGVNVNTTFNTYGALIENDQVTIYFNGEKVGVLETDDDNLEVPMTIIIDNYLWPGSADWHADNSPTPSTMRMTNMQVYTVTDMPPQS